MSGMIEDDGRLLAIYLTGNENKLMQVLPEKGEPVTIPYKKQLRGE